MYKVSRGIMGYGLKHRCEKEKEVIQNGYFCKCWGRHARIKVKCEGLVVYVVIVSNKEMKLNFPDLFYIIH